MLQSVDVFACAWAPLCLCGRCVEMVVVDMLDRIPDSLSESLMHKMPSSRIMINISSETRLA